MEFVNVDVSVSKQQGDVGVARAVYEFTKKGYTVLAPLSDSDKYDLVVDDGKNLLRVQVKTSRCKSKSGGYAINLKTSGGNTKINTVRKRLAGDYDLLFALVETGDCWCIPVSELGSACSTVIVGAKKYGEFKI